MNEKIRESIFSHPREVGAILKTFNTFNPTNRIRRKSSDNRIVEGVVLRKQCSIEIKGHGNIIEIEDYSRLIGTSIYVNGNNNYIHIGKRCYLYEAEFYIEDDNNKIVIGAHTSIHGATHFAAIEGTAITIGEDCMFSKDINVRTGDGHSIVDAEGNRINKSKDISIGNHCWIGMKAIILKGSFIRDDSVIGAAAVITKNFNNGNCIITGIPGTISKYNTSWKRERQKH